MTPSEKAVETRRKHREAQAEKARREEEIREKLKASCLSILDDPRTTPSERLEATRILHDLTKKVWC